MTKKRKEVELTYLDYLQGLRELSEYYIQTRDYNHFDEMISIQGEMLINALSQDDYDKSFQPEIDFYLKYSGLDNNDYTSKYSSIRLNPDEDDDNNDYNASDWIDEKKIFKDFSKAFKSLNKLVIK